MNISKLKHFSQPKTALTALTMAMAVAYAPASSADVVSYAQDFEAVDAGNPGALGPFGENFLVFADVWAEGGGSSAEVGVDVFLYQYGPFTAPNGGAGFSAVAGGEGGFYQGAHDPQP